MLRKRAGLKPAPTFDVVFWLRLNKHGALRRDKQVDFSIRVLGCIPQGMQRLVAIGAPKILPRIPAGMRPGMQAFFKTIFLKCVA
jgi:hypothetical protein